MIGTSDQSCWLAEARSILLLLAEEDSNIGGSSPYFGRQWERGSEVRKGVQTGREEGLQGLSSSERRRGAEEGNSVEMARGKVNGALGSKGERD